MKKVASFLLIALLLSFLVWGGEELFLSPTFLVLMVLDLIFAGIVIGLKNTPAWRIGLICLLTLLALTFLGDWLGPQALEFKLDSPHSAGEGYGPDSPSFLPCSRGFQSERKGERLDFFFWHFN